MLYANNRIVTRKYKKIRKIPTAILIQDKERKNIRQNIKKE